MNQTIILTLKTIELLHIGNLSGKRLPRAATLQVLVTDFMELARFGSIREILFCLACETTKMARPM